jgi:chaperonin GroES
MSTAKHHTVYDPLEDRVLVIPEKESEQKTDSGLFIPDAVKKDVMRGRVHAIGDGRYAPETGTYIPTILKKGDYVLFGAGQGVEVELRLTDETVAARIMREGDILLLIGTKEVAEE